VCVRVCSYLCVSEMKKWLLKAEEEEEEEEEEEVAGGISDSKK